MLLFPSIYDLLSSTDALCKSFQGLSLCVELCFEDKPDAVTTGGHQLCSGGIVGELRCREAVGTGEVPAGGTCG